MCLYYFVAKDDRRFDHAYEWQTPEFWEASYTALTELHKISIDGRWK